MNNLRRFWIIFASQLWLVRFNLRFRFWGYCVVGYCRDRVQWRRKPLLRELFASQLGFFFRKLLCWGSFSHLVQLGKRLGQLFKQIALVHRKPLKSMVWRADTVIRWYLRWSAVQWVGLVDRLALTRRERLTDSAILIGCWHCAQSLSWEDKTEKSSYRRPFYGIWDA